MATAAQHKKCPQDDMEKRFEDMAALKPALKDIGLDNTQKDTLDKLEKAIVRNSATMVARCVSLAQNAGADPDSLKALRTGARTLRDQELTEARGLLTDRQQPKFDQNVVKFTPTKRSATTDALAHGWRRRSLTPTDWLASRYRSSTVRRSRPWTRCIPREASDRTCRARWTSNPRPFRASRLREALLD